MSTFNLKTGWHPKGKDGGKESWRGDFKGINQVAGWMGKGKKSDQDAASEHVSRPLATLKDPSSFGPPPKNVNYHGGAALPNEITPDRGGWGAPMSQDQVASASRVAAAEPEDAEPEKPMSPPLPYRADRTGLSTSNLPPPPVRRDQPSSAAAPAPAASSQPKLPPRLPTRSTNSPGPGPGPIAEQPPPSYDSAATKPPQSAYLNQSAMDRLGSAGVSVSALGIGNRTDRTDSNPWATQSSQNASSNQNQSSLSELQSRFSRMTSSSSLQNGGAAPATPAQPTNTASNTAAPSWQQSRHALNTAQSFRKDPSSVSMADAQSAAQTAGQAQRSASAFKERHADSIAKVKAWDQKHKVTSKINRFLDDHTDDTNSAQQQQPQPTQTYAVTPSQTLSQPPQNPASTSDVTASIARKPPPPPPPKKPASMQAPPPVPMGTKPNFG